MGEPADEQVNGDRRNMQAAGSPEWQESREDERQEEEGEDWAGGYANQEGRGVYASEPDGVASASAPLISTGDSHGDAVAARHEMTNRQQTFQQPNESVYAGTIRRWCTSDCASEPSWGLIYSLVHLFDVLVLRHAGEENFSEGDCVAFEHTTNEDGVNIALNPRKISREEMGSIMTLQGKTLAEHPSRKQKVTVVSSAEQGNWPQWAPNPGASASGAGVQMPMPAAAPTAGQQQQQQQQPQQPQHQQQPCGSPAAVLRASEPRQPLSYTHQPPPEYAQAHPHVQVAQAQPTGPCQQVPQALPLQAQRVRPQVVKLLLEPPPMIENFDAKAVATALLTGRWQGERAQRSPRTWDVSRGGTVASQVGIEWCDGLQQALSSAHQMQDTQQVQHSPHGSCWGTDSYDASQWQRQQQPQQMYQPSMDGAHQMGADHYGGCAPMGNAGVPTMMMGMYAGRR
eukprot:TRINITY_DN7200_c0_g1_i1.p1 TRINITY_DN7200_c0_g1~~TRINITY_DN7200_c0_g1_i1.p1  ORF type:complete len:456 (-),score=109.21 TRINITY_DN7200_c0_g1_i1:11-1378(-)